MDRLQFLKAFGLTLGGGVLAKRTLLAETLKEPAAPARFKPGPEGKILMHRGVDGWTVHKDFGPAYEVVSVRTEARSTVADLRFQGGGIFRLHLDPSGREWMLQ